MTTDGVRPLRLVPGEQIEAWADPEVEAWFRSALLWGVPAPTSLAIEAAAPRVLRAFCRFWWVAFRSGGVDPSLKERIRVRMALAAGCAYCATSVAADAPALPPLPLDELPRDEAIALRVADLVAAEPWRLDSALRDDLLAAFGPEDLAQLLAFVAWQAGGPRAIRAWGAEAYKPGSHVDPASLPERLPWADVDRSRPLPPLPPPATVDPGEVLDAALATGSPPPAYVRLLAPRPDILAAWLGLLEATTTGDPLGDRVGAVVSAAVAGALLVPSWAPSVAPPSTDAEELAAAYARALALRGEVPDDLRAAALEAFGDGGVVQLGFAVAAQAGPIVVVRWLSGANDPDRAPIRPLD